MFVKSYCVVIPYAKWFGIL